MKYILLIILFTSNAVCIAHAQDKNRNTLFVEWKHDDSTVILGHFSDSRLKRIADHTTQISKLTQPDIEQWLRNSGSGALLFFHAMWGQQPDFHRRMCLNSMDKILAAAPEAGIQTTISFIWHAGNVRYLNNWYTAADKGEPMGKVLGWITQHYPGNTHVMCHSMGNRFFEGMVRTMPGATDSLFKNIILFSADIENRTADTDFMNCTKATKNLYVYVHRKDRILLLSSIVHGNKRLGRSGPDANAAPANLHVVDMTAYVPGLQNHTHLDRPWVQQSIAGNLR